MSFQETWLPNIVCTVAASLVSLYIGFYYAKKSDSASDATVRRLNTILVSLEEAGMVKLVRDNANEITGGRAIELRAEPANFGVALQPAELKVGSAKIDGKN